MKKTAFILLLSIYTVSTFGIGISKMYCCGHLQSTNLTVFEFPKLECTNNHSISDCCKTSFKNLKVKDIHIGAKAFHSPLKQSTSIALFTCFFDETVFAKRSISRMDANHAPPPNHGILIYILHFLLTLDKFSLHIVESLILKYPKKQE